MNDQIDIVAFRKVFEYIDWSIPPFGFDMNDMKPGGYMPIPVNLSASL